jgi:hypothetical protein
MTWATGISVGLQPLGTANGQYPSYRTGNGHTGTYWYRGSAGRSEFLLIKGFEHGSVVQAPSGFNAEDFHGVQVLSGEAGFVVFEELDFFFLVFKAVFGDEA